MAPANQLVGRGTPPTGSTKQVKRRGHDLLQWHEIGLRLVKKLELLGSPDRVPPVDVPPSRLSCTRLLNRVEDMGQLASSSSSLELECSCGS